MEAEREARIEKQAEEKRPETSREALADHFSEKYRLKANERYEAGGYRYETDKQGRIQHCEGRLRLEEETGRNPEAQLAAGGKDRHTGERVVDGEYRIDKTDKDDGGHLIARRFGGSPEIDNLVAQNSHLNRGEWKAMENQWERMLNEKDKNGEQKYDVDVSIRVKYRGDSERPSSFEVQTLVTNRETGEYEEGLCSSRRFKNQYQN